MGYIVLQRRIQIAEIAFAVAGDQDLFADFVVSFQKPHFCAVFCRMDCGHKSGCAAPDYDNIHPVILLKCNKTFFIQFLQAHQYTKLCVLPG